MTDPKEQPMPRTTPDARFTLLDRQTGEGAAMTDPDETAICEAFVNGRPCGREFPDEVAWQEHYEDEHAEATDG